LFLSTDKVGGELIDDLLVTKHVIVVTRFALSQLFITFANIFAILIDTVLELLTITLNTTDTYILHAERVSQETTIDDELSELIRLNKG
jgi:energy-converting hydrogenase A subunit M